MAIPFEHYREKLDHLSFTLLKMGLSAIDVVDWVQQSEQARLGMLRRAGEDATEMVVGFSRSDLTSIVGLRVASKVRAAQAQQIMKSDEDRLIMEIDEITFLEMKVNKSLGEVRRRVGMMRRAATRARSPSQATAENREQGLAQADYIDKKILPALERLANDLTRALVYARAGRFMRGDQIETIGRNKHKVPRFNNKARRNRLKYLKLKQDAAKKAKADNDEENEG
jgi:hypothetical protein